MPEPLDLSPTKPVAEVILEAAEYLNPIILLASFIISAATHSIHTAKNEDIIVPAARGPGGKPLPITRKKKDQDDRLGAAPFGPIARRAMQYVSVAVTFTFIGNGIAISL